MSESLGLTSHKSSCNCTGCGLLRAGVCINCAEKIAALILESGPRELAVEPCSGACREAIELYFSTPPGRLARAASSLGAPVGQPLLWTLAYGYHEDRTPTHGYGATREAAMAAFARSRRRE